MGLTVTHTFVSGKPDGADATLIQPQRDWNADHTLAWPSSNPLDYFRRKPNISTVDYEFAAASQVYSTDYVFPAQTPGGTLTASITNTITLTPVPLGVNGTNTGHSLYVSGGTGTAEAVVITGGTAVSGASSGTITFVPANNHSGAWTIQSATNGIQEAIKTAAVASGLSSGPCVLIPPGQHTIHARIYCDNYPSLFGAGNNSTVLLKGFAAGDLIYIGDAGTTLSGIGSQFQNFQIRVLPGITDTSGWAIHAAYRYNVTVENVTIYGDSNPSIGQIKNAIYFDNCLTFSLLDTKVFNITNVGLQLGSTGASQVTGRIVGVDITSAGTTNDLVSMFGNVLSLLVDGMQLQGGFNNWEVDTTNGQFSESTISNIVFDSATSKAFSLHGTGATFKLMFSNIELSTISSAPSTIGMAFDGTGASAFESIVVNNVTGGVNANNSIGVALFVISASNFLLSNSQLQGAGGGSGDTCVQIQGTTKNIMLSNNVLGYSDAGATTGAIAYRAVYIPSGTHTNLTILGNRIYGSNTGMGIAGAHTDLFVQKNRVASPGTPVSFSGTGTVLFDNLAVPFANLPSAVGNEGMQASVSDSSTVVWGATITGSSSGHVLAHSNGTNWTVVGK